MSVVPVGPKATTLICPSCKASVVTKVDHKSNTRTHIIACLLFICLCWPCICIPYCMDSCKNVDHYCPSCNTYIGTYQG